MTNHRFVYYSLQCPQFIDILKTSQQSKQFLDTYYELCRTSMLVISDPEKNGILTGNSQSAIPGRHPKRTENKFFHLPEISVSKPGSDQLSLRDRNNTAGVNSSLSILDSVSSNENDPFPKDNDPKKSFESKKSSNGQEAESQNSGQLTDKTNNQVSDQKQNIASDSNREKRTSGKDSMEVSKELNKAKTAKQFSKTQTREDFRSKQNQRSRLSRESSNEVQVSSNRSRQRGQTIWSKASGVKMRERSEQSLRAPKVKSSTGSKLGNYHRCHINILISCRKTY